MSDHTDMTTRWVVAQCRYCDARGYLPNGAICHHEPPEQAAERAHRGAQLARTQLAAAQDRRPPEEDTG